jgi:hypothetical protein
VNDKCIVAGNVSVYEIDTSTGRLACLPFPKNNPNGFQPQPTFHDRCQSTGKGPMVACNPLLYGAADDGSPFCVDSGNQPEFTKKATANCNSQSPLRGAPNSLERRADYERILKSYFSFKGGNSAALQGCFNQEHKIEEGCAKYFEEQHKEFVHFKDEAEKICSTVKLPDQDEACSQLRQRALELSLFLETKKVTFVEGGVIAKVDLFKQACEAQPLTWNLETEECYCADKRAVIWTEGKPECPQAPAAPMAPLPTTQDQCEKNKQDGVKDSSFKCNKEAWIFAAVVVGALAWVLSRPKARKPALQPPPPPPVPVAPLDPPVFGRPVPNPEPPPTITPPTTTTTTLRPAPRSEGGSGKAPGNSGGVR